MALLILQLFALTAGVAIGVLAATVGMLLLLMRVLQRLDLEEGPDDSGGFGDGGWDDLPSGPPDDSGEPAWWSEFERGLADHVGLGVG